MEKKYLFSIAIITIVVMMSILLLSFISIVPERSMVQGSADPYGAPSQLALREPMSAEARFTGLYFMDQYANYSYPGQLVSFNTSSGTWIGANSTSSLSLGKLGIVIQPPNGAGKKNAKILAQGLVYNSTWSWSKGTMLYVNVSGAISNVRPTNLSVVPIGWAYNTSVIYFCPEYNMTAIGE